MKKGGITAFRRKQNSGLAETLAEDQSIKSTVDNVSHCSGQNGTYRKDQTYV